MTVLFDTNIFTRAAQPGHPLHQQAIQAGDILKSRGETLAIVPQVLYEFWVVATRPPGENGLGLTTAEARSELARIKRLFLLLPETPAIRPVWEELVAAHDVKGRSAHDARIVASMNVHNVSHVLTFNGPDFARFPAITVLSPEAVVQGS
jgi:predicted nucleic acid-binding protein